MPLVNELVLVALVFLFGPVVVFWLVALRKVLFGIRLAARPTVRELDFAGLDPKTAHFLRTRAEALLPLGFDEPTLVDLPDAVSGVDGFLVLLANRRTGEKAIVEVYVGRVRPFAPRAGVVGFSTWFDTGEKVGTSYAADDGAWPPAPGDVQTTLPSVPDPARLLAVHRYSAGRHRPGGRAVLYPPGGGAEHLAARLADGAADLARMGYVRPDETGTFFRPTLRGASRVVWRQLPPGRELRRWALLRRERRLLAEWRAAEAAGEAG